MVAQETGGADLSQNGILVEALWHAVDHAAGNLEAVPGLVRRLLETDAWRCRSYKGKTYEHARFADFIATKPLAGCGWPPQKVEALIEDDAELLAMWREAMVGKVGRPAKENHDNVMHSRQGNSRAYTLNRLKRERPDLFNRVVAKEISANAAAIEAGFRHKATPYETILKLLSKLTADEREHLRELL
jgi:hypothetical protein